MGKARPLPAELTDAAGRGAGAVPRSVEELRARLEALRARPLTPHLSNAPTRAPGSGSGDKLDEDEADAEDSRRRLRDAQRALARADAEGRRLRAEAAAQRREHAARRGAQPAARLLAERLHEAEAVAARLGERDRGEARRAAAATAGLRAELTGLRQRLDAAERRQRQLRVLLTQPDGDRRDAVLARHAALAGREAPAAAAHAAADAQAPAVGLAAIAEELAALREGLLGAGRRLGGPYQRAQ
jgi:chromosome segregation ATPase